MPKLRRWKALPAEHRAYVYIYIVAILWCVTYYIFFPVVTSTFADRNVLALWILPVAIGAGVAIYGLLTRDNLLTERLGVTFVMLGPVIYGLLQLALSIIYLVTQPENIDLTARIPLVIMSFWLFLFLNKRRRELKILVKQVKETPLPSETEK